MVQAIKSISSALGMAEDIAAPLTLGLARAEQIPFQKFLDQAIDSLNQVSALEQSSNAAVEAYAKGNGSLEDAVFAMNELTTTMQMANQVLSNSVAAFRELEQMQI